MAALVDAKWDALRAQNFNGAMSDMTLQWLQANGATSPDITTAWYEMLGAQLGPQYTGDRSTDWYTLLGNLGYVGQVNERTLQFWQDGGSFNEFNFGTAHAIIDTPWVPLGLPWSISVTTKGSTNTNACLLAGALVASGGFQDLSIVAGSTGLTYLKADTLTNANVNGLGLDNDIVPTYWNITATGAETTGTVSTATSGAAGPPAASKAAQPYTTIGKTGDLTLPYVGVIKDIYFTDDSPIQGDTYHVGDNTTQGLLSAPVPIAGEFDISVDWVRSAASTSNFAFGSANNPGNVQGEAALRLYNENGGGNIHEVRLYTGSGSVRFTNALVDIADGQHFNIRLYRDSSNDVYLEIDGVPFAGGPINNTAGGTFDRIGANAGTDLDEGAYGNLNVSSLSSNRFPVYAEQVQGVGACVQKFAGTSAGDMGLLTTAGVTYHATNGFVAPNDGTVAQWASGDFSSLLPDAATAGFTLQFEIESGMFALDVSPAAGLTSVVYANGAGPITSNFSRDSTTDAWAINYNGDIQPSVQTNNITSGTHDTITYVLLGSDAGADEGIARIYRNQFLIAESPAPATVEVITNLYIGGISGLIGLPLNPEFAVRNVLLMSTAFVPVVNTNIAFIGDSLPQRGQYPLLANPNYPNSTPLKSGYDIASGDYPETPTQTGPLEEAMPGPDPLNASWFDESWFAHTERGLAAKGLFTDRVHTYARGGSVLYADPSFPPAFTAHLGLRVDAMQRTSAGEFPTPQLANQKLDIVVIHIGTNDRSVWSTGNYGPVDTVSMSAFLEQQIDRVIAVNNPTQILLCNLPPPPTGATEPDLAPTQAAMNAMFATFDGYGDVVTLVDLTGLDPGTMLLNSTNVHFNALGYKYVADQVNEAIDQNTSTYSYPLTKVEGSPALIENTNPETGAAYNGRWTADKWQYIPTNSRLYRINEGYPATTLVDALHDPDSLEDTNATLSDNLGWSDAP
mgnify:FL=1|tara:strand:- start:1902 stop:4796 length:2895 start_codon:yes stop_codon:yes gene_type:complete